MRTLILALCVPLLLGACQDTGAQGPPPTFSPSVQAFFEQYLNEPIPRVFVVSIDGQYASYRYCKGLGDVCVGQVSATHKAITHCEKNSGGVPCKVYAFGRRIKWTGEKGSGDPRVSPTPPPSCNLPFSEAMQLDAATQYERSYFCLEIGDEVRRKWSCLAAHSGFAGAQLSLGVRYKYGYGGVQSDAELSYLWSALAAKNGTASATDFVDRLRANMSPDQIAEAERQVAEWKPNPEECEIIGAQAEN